VAAIETAALPAIDYDRFADACALIRQGFAEGAVLAARDVSDGGPLEAIAEMAFAAGIGAMLFDDGKWYEGVRREAAWFGEAPGFVLEVADTEMEDFFVLAEEYGLYAAQLGMTIAEPELRYGSNTTGAIHERATLDDLREAWEAPLRDFYGSVA
jgi:phosphoribosylformylglycinamidine (FGAM) synthase-like enzyme